MNNSKNNQVNKISKRGFTLLELLIVIGILAVLATAATLVLNPVELLAQARDTQRIADLDALKAAIAMHLTTGTNPSVYYGNSGSVQRCMVGTVSPFTVLGGNCATVAARTVDGNGWVAVNLKDVSGGAPPLATLPIDPTNNATYYYAYAANTASSTFEIDAKMESTKYGSKASTDGGSNPNWYEVGTETLAY